MKILVLYEKGCGGETVMTENIVKEMRHNSKAIISIKSVETISNNKILSYLYLTASNIVKWISIIAKQRGVDWIYTTTYTAGLAAVFFKPFRSYKLCFHFHGSRIPPKNNNYSGIHILTNYIKHYLVFWAHIVFIKSCNVVLVPSNYSKKELERTFPDIIKNILIVPNGVDSKKYKPFYNKTKLNLIKSKINIDNKNKIILHISRLDTIKRIDLMIQTYKEILKRNENITLIIAFFKPKSMEEKTYKNKLKAEANKLEINKLIRWIENYKNTHHLYGISDIVISLSKKEQSPLVALEALASKSVFVSTPSGSTKRLLSEIDNRLIIKSLSPTEIANQINDLLSLTNTEKKQIVDKGWKLVNNNLTINESATRTLKILASYQK